MSYKNTIKASNTILQSIFNKLKILAGGKVYLSSDCVLIKYIEGTGTQYIDTGFKPNQDTRVIFNARVPKESSGATYVLGVNEWTDGQRFQIRITSSGNYYNFDYGSDGVGTTVFARNKGRIIFDINKNVCTVDNITTTAAVSTFQATANLKLLAGVTTGGSHAASPGQIYSCQIYDKDTLIRDFYPCLDSKGIACLYDTVSKTCYYSAGTDEFIAGMY